MTPLPPGAVEHLLKSLPPERPDPFPHLGDLTTDQLLHRRVEVTASLKTLEQERQAIDAELLEVFSDAQGRLKVISCRARGRPSKSEHCLDVVAQLLLACAH